jgi:hypothetical protein
MENVETKKPQNRLDRGLDNRATSYRPTSWQAPEALPMPEDRPGWKHRYVRLSTLGAADPSNISSKLREGYEPVKAEEYPELMMHAATEGRFKGGIEIGGLLLCRIPAEFMEQRAKHFENLNKSQMDSVDNNFLRERDARSNMALFADKKSKVTFGSGS